MKPLTTELSTRRKNACLCCSLAIKRSSMLPALYNVSDDAICLRKPFKSPHPTASGVSQVCKLVWHALDVLQCKITIVSWSCTGAQKDCAFKTSCCAMGLQNTIGTTKAYSHRAPTADPRGSIPLFTCMTQQCLLHICFKTFFYSLDETIVCAHNLQYPTL